jgi:putative ABC transport system substrate-binding protein
MPCIPGLRRWLWWAALALAAATLLPAQVPSAGVEVPKPARQEVPIGVFTWLEAPGDRTVLEGLTQGLRDAGIEPQFRHERALGDAAKATAGLAALRAAALPLVVAMGTEAALQARTALPGQPVLFVSVSHPLASGLCSSWEGAGGNLCGASTWIAPAEVLSVFELAVPNLKRLGMLRSAQANVVAAAEAATLRTHLQSLGAGAIELHEAFARTPAELPRAVDELLQQRVDAVWIPIDAGIYPHTTAVAQALAGRRVPLLTTAPSAVPAGAHIGALTDARLHGRRAAALALAVLRGAAPGRLPIDRMRSNRIVVNLFAARRQGLELPLSLLALADELLDPDLPHVPR